jgi:hypothetical protein
MKKSNKVLTFLALLTGILMSYSAIGASVRIANNRQDGGSVWIEETGLYDCRVETWPYMDLNQPYEIKAGESLHISQYSNSDMKGKWTKASFELFGAEDTNFINDENYHYTWYTSDYYLYENRKPESYKGRIRWIYLHTKDNFDGTGKAECTVGHDGKLTRGYNESDKRKQPDWDFGSISIVGTQYRDK